MVDWKFANKLRRHNRKETFKHFMAKAMAFKILFNAGYYVYSEYDMWGINEDGEKGLCKVADVYAESGNHKKDRIVVEIETKPTKKKNKELMKFYEDKTLYIVDLRKISDDINEMEKQIRHILGL